MNIRVILCMLLIASTSVSYAATSRIDNDFFAFKPRAIFAIKKDGQWVTPDYQLTLGLKGNVFVIDTRSATDVPTQCRRLLQSHDLVKMPPTNSSIPQTLWLTGGGQYFQIMDFEIGCDIGVWLSQGRGLASVKLPDTTTVINGLLEFRAWTPGGDGRQQLVLIEFLVGADDVQP